MMILIGWRAGKDCIGDGCVDGVEPLHPVSSPQQRFDRVSLVVQQPQGESAASVSLPGLSLILQRQLV